MNTDVLRKEFEDILTLEERARNFYDHYIEQVDDAELKKVLTSIRNDEKLHIMIAKTLIKCVS